MRTYTILPKTSDWNDIPVAPIDAKLWTRETDISATAQVCYDDKALYVRLTAKEKDIRLLDLIEDMRKAPNGNSSRVEYLSSPFEAEAWAQGLYFKEMLKAVVLEM